MAVYRVEIKRSAAREVDGVEPRAQRARIVARIRRLAALPRPPGVEKLAGSSGLYRVRQGEYRILYEIDDPDRCVTVIKEGHRREVDR